MKWHEHRPKKVTKTNSDKHKMKKWNDINLSQQKVGKTKSAKTWYYKKYRSSVKNAYLNFIWKILKSKIGKNCMKDIIK